MPNRSMQVTIRKALPTDCEGIHNLVRELAEYEKLLHRFQASPADYERSLFCKDPIGQAMVAEADGKLVGYAIFFFNYSSFLAKPGVYLEDLYVQPSLRGYGIGKRLFLSVASVAVEKNSGRMDWSVLEWNESAIKFYESMGAVMLKDVRGFRLTGPTLENAANSSQKLSSRFSISLTP